MQECPDDLQDLPGAWCVKNVAWPFSANERRQPPVSAQHLSLTFDIRLILVMAQTYSLAKLLTHPRLKTLSALKRVVELIPSVAQMTEWAKMGKAKV